jgi:hypothetical protein
LAHCSLLITVSIHEYSTHIRILLQLFSYLVFQAQLIEI